MQRHIASGGSAEGIEEKAATKRFLRVVIQRIQQRHLIQIGRAVGIVQIGVERDLVSQATQIEQLASHHRVDSRKRQTGANAGLSVEPSQIIAGEVFAVVRCITHAIERDLYSSELKRKLERVTRSDSRCGDLLFPSEWIPFRCIHGIGRRHRRLEFCVAGSGSS